MGLAIDVPGIEIALPLDRPLYRQPQVAEVNSEITEAASDIEPEMLFEQTFIDQTRLARQVRSLIRPRASRLASPR